MSPQRAIRLSLAFSREAWLLLASNFARVLDDPTDLAARSGMQLGACFAGLAIENSMLGAAHALANPLTAHYGIPHGQAVGLMLPHVIRFNGAEVGAWYHDLLECTAGGNGFPAPAAGYQGLADFVADLVQQAGLISRLREFEIPEEEIGVVGHRRGQAVDSGIQSAQGGSGTIAVAVPSRLLTHRI